MLNELKVPQCISNNMVNLQWRGSNSSDSDARLILLCWVLLEFV